MILEFHQPASPLGEYVELLTYYEEWIPDYSIERLLPDGAVHLIIELDDQPKYIFDNYTLDEKQRCTHAWVSGMHTQFLSISAVPHSIMLVIRFKAAGSYPILHLPLSELNNLVVDAELLFGTSVLELRKQLLDLQLPRQKFAAVEQWLMQQALNSSIPEAVVRFAVDRIEQLPSSQNIQHIVEKTGYSQKQFIHLFKKHVGLTPKQYQRILRFNRVLKQIEQRQSISWTQISHDCGYYDQAHFIKEFKTFAGFSPEAFLQQRQEYTNYVPLFESEVNFLQ